MKKTRIFLVTFLVLLAVAGSVAYWLYHQVNAFSGQKISVTEETIFTIPPGTGRVALEKKLAESGIIRNHTIMTGCCNWSRIWQKSKPVLTD